MPPSLKEQLEILRGEKIQESLPLDAIPCRETSDPTSLCAHPVVSVAMTTYMHEAYVAQAIESVVSQETDFEYELVIGEDASSDKTREICFEYQSRYPDKIRVLWSEENLYASGGNFKRVFGRCRGEFIAICEGDDWWSDRNKLSKQVEVMRTHDVDLCFSDVDEFNESTGLRCHCNLMSRTWKEGVTDGLSAASSDAMIYTCTAMFRRSAFERICERYELMGWLLKLGDKQIWKALALNGAVYYINEVLAVYRNHDGGVTKRAGLLVSRDGGVVNAYFARVDARLPFAFYSAGISQVLLARLAIISNVRSFILRRNMIWELVRQAPELLFIHSSLLGCWSAMCGPLFFRFYRKAYSYVRKRMFRVR